MNIGTDGQTPPVSIVIPTLNEEKYLPMLLDSLLGISSDFEVIVVDGHSDDSTLSVVGDYANKLPIRSIVSAVRNAGAQRNLGARDARHPLLMFIDADAILPSRDTYMQLVQEFHEKNLDAASTNLHPHDHGSGLFPIAVLRFAKFLQLCAAAVGRIPFTGACILTTRDFFHSICGFDESLLLAEDIDFGLRARHRGRCGLLSTSISISMRRFTHMTPRQAFEIAIALPFFLLTARGTKRLHKHYRFGEF